MPNILTSNYLRGYFCKSIVNSQQMKRLNWRLFKCVRQFSKMVMTLIYRMLNENMSKHFGISDDMGIGFEPVLD